MSTNVRSPESRTNYFLAAILGIVTILLVGSVVAGIQLPVINTDRAVFFAVAIVGLAMCIFGGIGPAITRYGWSHWYTIVGSLLGVLMLLLAAGVLFNIQLPVIDSERTATYVLAGIMVIKVVLVGAQTFLMR
jgi:hypothetical protein